MGCYCLDGFICNLSNLTSNETKNYKVMTV